MKKRKCLSSCKKKGGRKSRTRAVGTSCFTLLHFRRTFASIIYDTLRTRVRYEYFFRNNIVHENVWIYTGRRFVFIFTSNRAIQLEKYLKK